MSGRRSLTGIGRISLIYTLGTEEGEIGDVRLRTTPLYADWVDLGPERVREVGGGISIFQPPGTYTVTLVVDGEDVMSKPLTVLKDPFNMEAGAGLAQLGEVVETCP